VCFGSVEDIKPFNRWNKDLLGSLISDGSMVMEAWNLPSERDALQAIAETIVGAFKQSL